MQVPLFLHAPPLLVLTALLAAACGGKVVAEGAGGTGAGGDTGAGVFAACGGPGECVLVPNGCCGPCVEPDFTTLASINSAQSEAFHQFVCPAQSPCPKCATLNADLFAYCEAGGCSGAD